MKISDHRAAGPDEPAFVEEPVEMSLMEHLEELRSRLFKIVFAYALCCVGAWYLYSRILAMLIEPLTRLPVADQILREGQLIYTAPTEAFLIRLKVTAFTAMVFALPVILWQLWRFVTPGLHAHEKKYALPFVFVSLILFALGVTVAFISLPKALEVLAGFAGTELVLLPRASDYLSFVLILIAAFGFSFEFPVILLGLTLVGVLSSAKLLGPPYRLGRDPGSGGRYHSDPGPDHADDHGGSPRPALRGDHSGGPADEAMSLMADHDPSMRDTFRNQSKRSR